MSAMLFILDKIDKSQATTAIYRDFHAAQGSADSVNKLISEIQHELR